MKNKQGFITLVLLTVTFNFAFAQSVSTFGNVQSNGDVAVDAQGYVYTVSENNSIRKISPQGDLDPVPFLNGGTLNRGTGLAFNPSGDTLYVTCRPLDGKGFISKVAPDGTDEVFCDSLYFPGDIAFDPSGNIYVTEFNNNITKISPSGDDNLYVNDPGFNTPIGIAWTPGDTIFVASAHDGNIFKVSPTQPTPTVQWFAHVDGLVQNWACGFMTYTNGALFITNGDNIIHKITLDGIVSDFAGTGVGGGQDGSVQNCEFQAPNGIGASANGEKMYITEYNKFRVREIDFTTAKIEEIKEDKIKIFPNPSKDFVIVESKVEFNMMIYNNQGQVVMKSKPFEIGKNKINISSLKPGQYFIQMTTKEAVSKQSLIIN